MGLVVAAAHFYAVQAGSPSEWALQLWEYRHENRLIVYLGVAFLIARPGLASAAAGHQH